MTRRARRQAAPRKPPEFLRAWREACGLSRERVVTLLQARFPEAAVSDQAALAKIESGDVWVTLPDLEMLAEIYGVTVDRLFFAPNDAETPALLRAAHEVIASKDREAVRRWLEAAKGLRDAQPPGNDS